MEYLYTFIFVMLGAITFSTAHAETGLASWYGPGFHGKLMANGQPFNQHALTVAHKTLPLGTYVKVVSTQGGKSIVAQVTDRGPYKPGRIVDLSYGAAKKLGVLNKGVQKVEVQEMRI